MVSSTLSASVLAVVLTLFSVADAAGVIPPRNPVTTGQTVTPASNPVTTAQLPTAPPSNPAPTTQLPVNPPNNPQTTGNVPTIPPGNPQTTGNMPTIPPGNPQTTGNVPTIPPGNPQTTGNVPTIPPGNPQTTANVPTVRPINPAPTTQLPPNPPNNPDTTARVPTAPPNNPVTTARLPPIPPSNPNGTVSLPTNVNDLFADVYNNNSVSLYLKSLEPQYASGQITRLAPGFYLANKYSMGNSLWIVTPQNSIIVVDTPETVEMAAKIRDDMRNITEIGNKPIRFIIYTLFHGDHTYGAAAFVNDPANGGQKPQIIAHRNFLPQTDFFDNYRFIKMNRDYRIFGSLLPPNVLINPFSALRLGGAQTTQFYPNILLDMNDSGETTDLILESVQLQFVYTPGYTADQIVVWFPESKVLACANHFYENLPNIYTIRGEPPRDALAWAKTTRLVRTYNAEYLSPSQLAPLIGKEVIATTLEQVADTLQYIHDQTVRLLAKGLTADVAARQVQLPASLATASWNKNTYGTVEGHSRSVADFYTGWFNGEIEDLLPVSKMDLAANMVRDFGRTQLLQLARKAYNEGDYRYALTLATYVWRAENKARNDALYWRTQAAKRLAESLTAVQWRNYLLSTTMIDWGFVSPQDVGNTVIVSRPFYLALRSIEDCFELLAMHVDPVKAAGVDQTIDLYLTNDPDLQADEFYRLRLRNSVLFVDKLSNNDLWNLGTGNFTRVQTDSSVWRQILAGEQTVGAALNANSIIIMFRGNADLETFLTYFDFVDMA